MKRIVLGLVFACAFLVGFGQTQVFKGELTTMIDSLDLSTISGTDTTIYFAVPQGAWGVDIQFATITGTGTAQIVAGHHSTDLELYDTNSTVSVTGASGGLKFDHDRLAWRYLGIKITVGTITAGTLNATILVR